jgi:hypothetical protein
LIAYNDLVLPQALVPPSKTMVGVSEEGDTLFRSQFERVIPQTVFEPTGDKHALIVTTIRKRIPLYSLTRIRNLRRHYLDVLESRAEPLHVDSELALLPDLAANPMMNTGVNHLLTPAAAFALGRALQFIEPNTQGVYGVVDRATNKLISQFSDGRLESAVLLSADDIAIKKVSEWVDQYSTVKGNEAFTTELNTYLKSADITEWERAAIAEYTKLLSS